MAGIDRIDHICFAVHDLTRAAAAFRALGFTLTARADHTVPGPDGKPRPTGTAQHTATFAGDYIEIMAIVDPCATHYLSRHLARGQGIYILALGADDIDRAYAELNARQVAVTAPKDWARDVLVDGKADVARFKYCTLPMEHTPEGLIAPTQQLTPELVRPASLTRHANTALGIDALWLTSPDPARTAARYRALLGTEPIVASTAHAFRLGSQQLIVTEPAHVARHFHRGYVASSEAFAACTVRVDSIEQARARAAASGLVCYPMPGGFWVDGGGAFGGVLGFVGGDLG